METLQFNTVYSGNLSNYGGYIYQLDVQQDGVYRIEVSPGVRTFVYVYGAEVLPDQQGYYTFSKDTFPIVYLSGGANKSFTVQAIKENFTISNVNYNNGAGAKLGTNNKVSLRLSKHSEGTKTYQVSLYCAGSADGEGGLRSETQEVTLNGSTSATVTFDNVALYGGGAGTIYTYVKVSLAADGVGVESNRIQSVINGVLPQEIKFERTITDSDGVDHYYLFDDHPEHVRKCDLLDSDDPNYPNRLLSHNIALPPGKYLAFSYHHVNSDLFGTPIYFDGVFYNTGGRSGNVTITKLTLSSGNWNIRRDPWQNYIEGNNVLSRENFSVTGTNPFWLSSITGLKQISNELTDGVVHMMMEFEVTGGTVNFATAAYKNAVTAKNYFLNHQEETESVYENLNTILKGKGATAQIISAQEINYIIDGSDFVRGYLPVIINNDAYANKEQKVFTTQAHILNDNIRAAEPGSSIVPLEYEGIGITRGGENQESGYLPSKTWTFDGTHTAAVANIEIPEDLRQYFGDKEWFASNEDIKPWLSGIMDQDYWQQIEAFQYLGGVEGTPGVVNVPQPYQLTYQFKVNVTNSDPQNLHNFSYILEANDAYIQYNVQGKENKYRNYFFVEQNDSNSHTEEVFGYWIDPGETITCDIKITMVGGSLPTFKHAFIIDATEAEKTASLLPLIEK